MADIVLLEDTFAGSGNIDEQDVETDHMVGTDTDWESITGTMTKVSGRLQCTGYGRYMVQEADADWCFANMEVEGDLYYSGDGSPGLLARVDGALNYIGAWGRLWSGSGWAFSVQSRKGGSSTELATGTAITSGDNVRLRVSGDLIKVYINDSLEYTEDMPTDGPFDGTAGVHSNNGTSEFDNFKMSYIDSSSPSASDVMDISNSALFGVVQNSIGYEPGGTRCWVQRPRKDFHSWFYKDHGAGHWGGDWSYDLILYVSSMESSGQGLFLVSDEKGTYQDLVSGSDNFCFLNVSGDGGSNNINCGYNFGGTSGTSSSYSFSTGTVYYCRFSRDDDGGGGTGQLRLQIWTGDWDDTSVSDVTLNLPSQQDFRYTLFSTRDDTGSDRVSFYVEDLDLGEGGGVEDFSDGTWVWGDLTCQVSGESQHIHPKIGMYPEGSTRLWCYAMTRTSAFGYYRSGSFDGDLTHKFELTVDRVVPTLANYDMFDPWKLTSYLQSQHEDMDDDRPYEALRARYKNADSNQFSLDLRSNHGTGGNNVRSEDSAQYFSVGTTYFITVERDETAGTLEVWVRTGSHAGTLVWNDSISLAANTDYAYVMVGTRGEDTTANIMYFADAAIENYDLGSGTEDFGDWSPARPLHMGSGLTAIDHNRYNNWQAAREAGLGRGDAFELWGFLAGESFTGAYWNFNHAGVKHNFKTTYEAVDDSDTRHGGAIGHYGGTSFNMNCMVNGVQSSYRSSWSETKFNSTGIWCYHVRMEWGDNDNGVLYHTWWHLGDHHHDDPWADAVPTYERAEIVESSADASFDWVIAFAGLDWDNNAGHYGTFRTGPSFYKGAAEARTSMVVCG